MKLERSIFFLVVLIALACQTLVSAESCFKVIESKQKCKQCCKDEYGAVSGKVITGKSGSLECVCKYRRSGLSGRLGFTKYGPHTR